MDEAEKSALHFELTLQNTRQMVLNAEQGDLDAVDVFEVRLRVQDVFLAKYFTDFERAVKLFNFLAQVVRKNPYRIDAKAFEAEI